MLERKSHVFHELFMQDGQKKNLHTLTQTGMPVPGRNLQEPGCPPSVLITQLPKFSGNFLPPSTGVCDVGFTWGMDGFPLCLPSGAEGSAGCEREMWSLPEIPCCEGALGAALQAAAREIGSAPTQTLQQAWDPALLQDLPSQWIPEPPKTQRPNPLSGRCFPKPLWGHSHRQLCLRWHIPQGVLPGNSRMSVCPVSSTVRTGTSRLLRQFRGHFHSKLSPWGWGAKAEPGERDWAEKGRKEGADEASQQSHPQPPAFPVSINRAQERTAFLLFQPLNAPRFPFPACTKRATTVISC